MRQTSRKLRNKGWPCYQQCGGLGKKDLEKGQEILNGRPTIAMNDARRLRESLHPKDRPKIDRREGVFPFRCVTTQYQQVVAEYSEKGPWCLLWRETFYLIRGRVALPINQFKPNSNLAHNSRQQKRAIHDKPPVSNMSFHRCWSELFGKLTDEVAREGSGISL